MGSRRRQSKDSEAIRQVNYHWSRSLPVLIVIIGLGQFAFGISKAVEYFPTRFSFQRQFLSELGQTRISASVSNGTSCSIFTATMVFLGLSLIPLFLKINDKSGAPDPVSRTLGVASALSIIGIGVTPFDRVEGLHLLALGCWLLSLIGLASLRVIRTIEVGGAVPWTGFVSGSLILSIAGYVLSFGDRSTAPFAQKIAILAALFWALDLIWEVSKFTVEIIVLRRTHHRAVEDYLTRLTSQPLYRAQQPNHPSSRRQ